MGNRTVSTLFEMQVSKTPDRVALRSDGSSFTFLEVAARVNDIAAYLHHRGVGPEVRVGLALDYSLNAIVALLGILKASGTYVPLSPSLPAARFRELARSANLVLALTDAFPLDRLHKDACETVPIDQVSGGYSKACESCPGVTSDLTAYISFTSGSTGKPRGVISSHRSILNGLEALPFDKSPDEVCALNSSLSFGFSVSRLFLPLLSGVPLVVLSEEQTKDPDSLVAIFEAYRVTSAAFVTPFFREILNAGSRLTSRLQYLRTVTIGGASVNPNLLDKFRTLFPRTKLINGYGASEIGGAAIIWEDDPKSGSDARKSKCFPNTTIHILDETLNEVPAETVGALYVGAAHLSPGYLDDPVSTAERFIPDPFSSQSGCRLFKTGDLAVKRDNGDIEILGRSDDVVKVRGFRIELNEVEQALQQHESVSEAAVMADAFDELVAYIISATTPPTTSELRRHLDRLLPHYMIPSRFVGCSEFPRTHTGKLDRTRLKAIPPVPLASDHQHIDPRNDLESALLEIWSDVLAIEEIGINDNFFELGGHSLLAMQVKLRVYDVLGLEIPLEWILQEPTILSLADHIREQIEA